MPDGSDIFRRSNRPERRRRNRLCGHIVCRTRLEVPVSTSGEILGHAQLAVVAYKALSKMTSHPEATKLFEPPGSPKAPDRGKARSRQAATPTRSSTAELAGTHTGAGQLGPQVRETRL
ncbi:MAG TPA: hypothetical protein VH008_25275, partial [Pseudonocardia sp.]|nr:hypothetical protein [Pseudonocardia sp.]